MGETRSIVILANSIRNQNRCVAGKFITGSLKNWQVGDWVRLIDPDGDGGEVREEQIKCAGGEFVQVLDVIQVSLEKRLGDPDHPEDWLITRGVKWIKKAQLGPESLPRLADRPAALWQDGSGARSLYAGFVRKMPRPASLFLIENPANCKATWWREEKPDPKNACAKVEKVRRRLSFRYNGGTHEFDITDPEFTKKHHMWDIALSDRHSIELKPPLFVCVSLTKPWQSKHFKIAATIIQP